MGGRRAEAEGLKRKRVEGSGRARGEHALHKEALVNSQVAAVACRRQRRADDDGVAVCAAHCGRGQSEHLRIANGVDVAIAPVRGYVRLVPHLIEADAVAELLRKGRSKGGEVSRILGRGKGLVKRAAVACGARPVRAAIEHDHRHKACVDDGGQLVGHFLPFEEPRLRLNCGPVYAQPHPANTAMCQPFERSSTWRRRHPIQLHADAQRGNCGGRCVGGRHGAPEPPSRHTPLAQRQPHHHQAIAEQHVERQQPDEARAHTHGGHMPGIRCDGQRRRLIGWQCGINHEIKAQTRQPGDTRNNASRLCYRAQGLQLAFDTRPCAPYNGEAARRRRTYNHSTRRAEAT